MGRARLPDIQHLAKGTFMISQLLFGPLKLIFFTHCDTLLFSSSSSSSGHTLTPGPGYRLAQSVDILNLNIVFAFGQTCCRTSEDVIHCWITGEILGFTFHLRFAVVIDGAKTLLVSGIVSQAFTHTIN